MPQMAPISWLILFFVFTMAFILFNMLNYYCFNYNNNNNINNSNKIDNKSNISMNWKW